MDKIFSCYGSDSDSDELNSNISKGDITSRPTNSNTQLNTDDIVDEDILNVNNLTDGIFSHKGSTIHSETNSHSTQTTHSTDQTMTSNEVRTTYCTANTLINPNRRDSKSDHQHYFGLFTTDDSDDLSDEDNSVSSAMQHSISSQAERNNLQKAQYMDSLRCEGDKQSNFPSGSFWSGDDSGVDWTDTEQIWNSGSSKSPVKPDIDIEQLPKCPRLRGYNRHSNDKTADDKTNMEKKDFCNFKLKKPCFFIHNKIAPVLGDMKHIRHGNRLPKRRILYLAGHAGAVNRIKWCCPSYSHLLLSVSMDQTVKVWNTMSQLNTCIQNFKHHTKAVKDACWSHDGRQILSCGYDKVSRLMDVESGVCVRVYEEDAFVTCLRYHPVNYHLFISGSSNRITAWDCRKPNPPVQLFKYKDAFGQVQDLEFLSNGREFFSCNDLVSRDSADRNVMAWDFLKGVNVSNQIYQERYTCTRLKVHQVEPHLLAQTQGDYIAQFSTMRPYKMNKCKRFEGHQVKGYNVGFDLSPDGHTLVSGSSDGSMPFYDYRTTRKIGTVNLGPQEVCLDVAWHPLLPSTIATATWAGHVTVWM